MFRPARSASRTDSDRPIADLVREGVIKSIDLNAGKAVVRMGDILTPPIDWLDSYGETIIWNPPSIGEQVVVLCPEGDIERALIARGLPSSTFAHLFLGSSVGIQFKDGARITYDPKASVLDFQLPGSVQITAPDGVVIKADVRIEGNLNATGVIKGDVDVVGGGKSLKDHPHGGVTTGGGFSGPPR